MEPANPRQEIRTQFSMELQGFSSLSAKSKLRLVQSGQQMHVSPVTAQRWVPCSRPAMAATPDRPEDTFWASSNTILHHLKQ